ncbi:alpha/beta fold hydrolase [Georgenia ruanii]|uniref:Alpha/beta fold hydrolase n=1 Tax=Georgenia ruanii TaxID=348442 RepID=A0A7J9UY74_9MICO|nr:alpha/beta hydrolase [Georgenia ruanii]MPV89323.1 alpha/beta fold hydrolase [Georgenia ruanii]
MPYLKTDDDVELYFEDFGDGAAVVFVHGLSETHAIWEHQAADLADEFRTVTFDWRGVGRSCKPRAGYTLDAVTSDLISLITHLDSGPVTLVAQGTGNNVALEATYRRPDLVAGLALVCGAPWRSGTRDGVDGGLTEEFVAWASQNLGGSSLRPKANAELYDRYMFFEDPGPAVKEWYLNMAFETPLHVLKTYNRNVAGADHRGRLSEVRCPVLVAHGRHDKKQRYEGAQYFAEHISGAHLVTFENSAHQPQLEEVARFNEELRTFLGGT